MRVARPILAVRYAAILAAFVILTVGCHSTVQSPVGRGGAGDRIVVTDAATGKPITGASVEIAPVDPLAIDRQYVVAAKTDAQGRALIGKPAGATAFDLRVQKQGYVPLGTQSPDLATEMHVALQRGTRIGGVVLNERNQPVAGADVEIGLVEAGAPDWQPLLGGVKVKSAADGAWSYDGIPPDARRVSLAVDHPDYAESSIDAPSIRTLRAGKNTIIMHDGVEIVGNVSDAQGKPIDGAAVSLGYAPLAPQRATTSDASGGFRLQHVVPTRTLLLVQRAGFAPLTKTIIPKAGEAPLQIKLDPGQTVRGRVTDHAGKPVAGATISVTQWGELGSTFLWSAKSDADGRFAGNKDWPADPVSCVVIGPDGAEKAVTLTAGEAEQSIVLDPPLRVDGTITEAGTNKPLRDVRVTLGTDQGDGSGMRWDIGASQATRDGTFLLAGLSGSAAAYQLAFQLPGYVPAASQPIAASNGDVHLHIELRRYVGPQVVVVNSAGRPLANVQATLAKGGDGINIANGQAAPTRAFPVVVSGADGRVYLDWPKEPYVAAFVAADGYAIVRSDELVKSPRVQLKPWCSVTGTNLRAGKPAGDELVMVQSQRMMPIGSAIVQVMVQSADASDADGHFEVGYCIAGPAVAGRDQKDESMNAISELFSNAVTVVEGKPAEVVIGREEGRRVVGRAVPPPGMGRDWSDRCSVMLAPAFQPQPLPKDFGKMDAAAIQKWQQEASTSEAAQKMMQEMMTKTREATPQKDGSFALANVSPGKYQLIIRISPPLPKIPIKPGEPGEAELSEPEPLAQFTREITVPGGDKDAAIDEGRVELKAPIHIKTGDPAPPLVAKALDGKSITLESLRGKYVLLQMTAPGAPPQEVELPAMQAIAAAYGADRKFAMVSLNLIGDADTVRESAAKSKMTWDQWLMGDIREFASDWSSAGEGLILIDPQGKVVAMNLHGKEAQDAVVKALTGKP